MPQVDARVRSSFRTRAFAFWGLALAVAASPRSAVAGDLRLPPSAAGLLADVEAACPTCPTTGYVPCGSPAVGWGERFARHAALGTPKRAYLPTFAWSGDAFRSLARATSYPALVATLRARFATTRLLVIEDDFARVRVLGPPEHVDVAFPRALHECVADPARPWGCCVGDCARECCEKGLGSPEVTLAWQDGGERLTFHYAHTIGVSWLDRRGPAGRVRYACLTDARGVLRAARPR